MKNGKAQKRGRINLIGRLQLSTEKTREEEKMRLLILANTLPILVEANDQGPLTAPQLFSPFCASCARAEIAKSQRREKCEANLVIEEDVWGKGSCLSSTPHIQRARRGRKTVILQIRKKESYN